MTAKTLEQVTLHAIGGGWGDEQPGPAKLKVAVIRGTDIPRLRLGDYSTVPFRFETEGKVKKRLLQDGDLVIEVSGGSAASGQHTGRALLVTKEIIKALGGNVIPASFCRLLRLDSSLIDPAFIAYQIDNLHISGEIAEFENQSTGISNFQFTRFIQETHPAIFPISAQKEITRILRDLDRKIAINRRINQTLEAMANAIFKSWFVDFDPVKAKISALQEGRDPLRAAMSAISGKPETELDALPREQFEHLAITARLFPDNLEDSDIGGIPRGWRASSFGSLIAHTIGGDWGSASPDSSNDTRVAIIRGTDIPDLDQAQSLRVPTRYTTQRKLASRQLQVGDIVLEVSGGSKDQPTGRSIRITENTMREFDCPIEPASFCRLLRPISPQIGVILGLHLAHIYALGKTWEYQNQSTGIANFQTTHFLEAELVATPPAEIAEKFYTLVNPLLERRHDAQSRRLATLRDSLLPKLLSGEFSAACAQEETKA